MRVTVVVPTYNEADNIDTLVRAVRHVYPDYPFEEGPHLDVLEDTHRKLGDINDELARTFVYRDGLELIGHASGVRTYSHTWMLQHLMVLPTVRRGESISRDLSALSVDYAESIEDVTDEHLDQTLRTNLYGYFYMARAASPHLGSGDSIINTGSETGLFGSSKLLDYSMTKGGIHAFTKALASNLVSRGIRVNAVAPGPVWTPLNPADKPAEKVKDFGKHNPMGRPAQPEELAPAYVFLAAPSCASYISGAVIPVMGGPTG